MRHGQQRQRHQEVEEPADVSGGSPRQTVSIPSAKRNPRFTFVSASSIIKRNMQITERVIIMLLIATSKMTPLDDDFDARGSSFHCFVSLS